MERLSIDSPQPGRFVLTRRLAQSEGPEASLVASGSDLDAIFTQVQAVSPERQFLGGANWSAALHHEIDAQSSLLRLSHAELAVLGPSGLALSLKMPKVKGYPGEMVLNAGAQGPQALPNDLLAVLGRRFGRLDRYGAVWRCDMRLSGTSIERSLQAERGLADIGAHLALTLSEPPECFHERLAARRWRLAARRTLPLLTLGGLIGAALAVPSLGIAEDSVWRMLLLNSPPLLLAFGVSLRELPRFELPRRPRPLRPTDWQASHPMPSASRRSPLRPTP
jgi:hypothetical protein